MQVHLGVALLFLPALAGFGGLGQSIIGTVEKVGHDQLQIKGPDGSVMLRVDEKTTVRKGKTRHDLSALAIGDEVRVNYYGEQQLTAVDISAKIEVSGIITEAGAGRMVIMPGSTAAAEAPDKKKIFVFLSRATKFGTSRRSQLAPGRRVHVVGWDAGDGVVDAERVAIYETDLPAQRARPRN